MFFLCLHGFCLGSLVPQDKPFDELVMLKCGSVYGAL